VALFGFDSTNNDADAIEDGDDVHGSNNVLLIGKTENKRKRSSSLVHDLTPAPKATIAYAVSLTSCGAVTNRHDNIANGGHSSDPSFH